MASASSDAKLGKRYNAEEIERKWLERWDDSLYRFKEEDVAAGKPPYIIDTPPPYPTGDFHIGNALNWCYIDFIARYKRMRGYAVLFPQGWDCHGLPTEVKVEETHGISKRAVSKQEFRRLCSELTRKNIAAMKEMMIRLGFSIDWSREFVTMHDDYKKYTQRSFLRMFRSGEIYRAEHPVNWCPRCETAIAFAEVEYEERSASLNYIRFKIVQSGEEAEKDMRVAEESPEYVEIATTRPELLASCVAVAVHPEDERYKHLIGSTLEVPIFHQKVKVFADSAVDPSFGTGVVMICTFGDRQDVRWWKAHRLPLRASIDERGRMTHIAGKYAGMNVEECKKKIIEDLKKQGLLVKQERIKQSVGVCWRCKTPIEIISAKQWFVRVHKEKVKEAARKIKWHPEHFRLRLENWVDSMEWDWCISRQRIFGVPIPVWYCKRCGAVKLPSEDELPVDPTTQKPSSRCEKCGSDEFIPEEDVLDTWMDSSLSALWVAGWNYEGDFKPVQLRPQGHDIIRTWAFYTILRCLSLTGKIPWEMILINGMVLGEDGFKMSKSRNNIISPEEVVAKHGADAFRQWAALGGAVGSDVQFRWKDVVAAERFLQKLWSILRFSLIHLADYKPLPVEEVNLKAIDKWLLAKLSALVASVTEDMEKFKFDDALKQIKAFAWGTLADDYIEIAKSRLYGDSKSGEEGRNAARFALFETMKTLSLLIAPFMPFFAEEMHERLLRSKGMGARSVHAERWPEAKTPVEISDEDVREGEIIAEIVRSVRRLKAKRGIPLNKPLRKIEIFCEFPMDVEDIENATATPVEVKRSESLESIEEKMNKEGESHGNTAKIAVGDAVRAFVYF